MRALGLRAREGGSYHVRASLLQTATWFRSLGRVDPVQARALEADEIGRLYTASDTAWGPVRHLAPVARMSATPPRWQQVTVPLGTHPPCWSGG